MSAPFGQQIYQDVTNGVMYPINTTGITVNGNESITGNLSVTGDVSITGQEKIIKTYTGLNSSSSSLLLGAPSLTVSAAFSGLSRDTATGDVIINASDNVLGANSANYLLKVGPNPAFAVGTNSASPSYWLSQRTTGGAPAGDCTGVVVTQIGIVGALTVQGAKYMRMNGVVFITATILGGTFPASTPCSIHFDCDQIPLVQTGMGGASGVGVNNWAYQGVALSTYATAAYVHSDNLATGFTVEFPTVVNGAAGTISLSVMVTDTNTS